MAGWYWVRRGLCEKLEKDGPVVEESGERYHSRMLRERV